MSRSESTLPRENRPESLATLAEQAYQQLRHQILHGELEPGVIVSERMLAERVQLGKAPVRVAVQRLASERFLTIEPRRGIVISPRSVQDIIDQYEIRAVLEQLVVRQIAGKLRPEQVDRLLALVEEHRAIAETSEPARTLSADFAFHRLLCEFHGNSHLIAVFNRILDALFPELRLSHEKAPERVAEAVREHQAVAEALIRGDAAEAERLMTKHLSSCQQFLLSRGST